jgi:hypothetical protein
MRLIASEYERPLVGYARRPVTEEFKWCIVSQKIVVMVAGRPITARSLR